MQEIPAILQFLDKNFRNVYESKIFFWDVT